MTQKLFSVFIFSIFGFIAPVASAQTIGETVKADDTVRGSKAGKLSKGTKVVANERITANRTGLGHFLFNDGTKMVVGPGTRLKLDETVYNPNRSTFKKFAIDSSAGALRFISGNSNSNSYEIQTPTGTLGVRGTAFDLRHYRGRTYVMLVNGEIEICSRLNRCETLRSKCSFVVASPSGRVSDPVLPQNGQFERQDMERYFPLVFDQTPIEPSFRLNVSGCAAAAQFTLNNDPDGGGSDGPGPSAPDPGQPGPGEPDPSDPDPSDPDPDTPDPNEPDTSDPDTIGRDGGNDGGPSGSGVK